MVVYCPLPERFLLFYKISTINRAGFSTGSRIPGAVSAPPDPQCDSKWQMENQTFPVNPCFYTKVIVGYGLASFPWWSVLGIPSLWLSHSKQGISGKQMGSPGPGEPAEWVPGGLEWWVSRGQLMNSKGIKEEILPGSSGLELAPWRQLFKGERSFLAWAYTHTHTSPPCAGHS